VGWQHAIDAPGLATIFSHKPAQFTGQHHARDFVRRTLMTMNAQMVLTMGQDALIMMLMVAAPVLGVILVVGLLISLFQAVTQINEATLAFVPKLIAAMAVFALAGPWMLTTLVEYIRRTFEAIPSAVM
jgi:flagellar biosynthetic protein FliQ